MPASVQLHPLPASAAGELLTLQRAAYVSEAQAYGDPFLPALVQGLDDLRAELDASRSVGAWAGSRLVGAVRSREHDGTLRIGRLVVAPDQQGRGIGTALLGAVEDATRLPRDPGLRLVHLAKPLPEAQR